jgi:hypothetical protein
VRGRGTRAQQCGGKGGQAHGGLSEWSPPGAG